MMRSVRSNRTENPKTVLAFFATVLGIVLTAVVLATGLLVRQGGYEGAVIAVLVFGGGLAVLLIGAVFTLTLKDPSKLMLGQVTGTEYAEIQRVTLGDSSSGERTAALLPVLGAPLVVASVEPTEKDESVIQGSVVESHDDAAEPADDVRDGGN